MSKEKQNEKTEMLLKIGGESMSEDKMLEAFSSYEYFYDSSDEKMKFFEEWFDEMLKEERGFPNVKTAVDEYVKYAQAKGGIIEVIITNIDEEMYKQAIEDTAKAFDPYHSSLEQNKFYDELLNDISEKELKVKRYMRTKITKYMEDVLCSQYTGEANPEKKNRALQGEPSIYCIFGNYQDKSLKSFPPEDITLEDTTIRKGSIFTGCSRVEGQTIKGKNVISWVEIINDTPKGDYRWTAANIINVQTRCILAYNPTTLPHINKVHEFKIIDIQNALMKLALANQASIAKMENNHHAVSIDEAPINLKNLKATLFPPTYELIDSMGWKVSAFKCNGDLISLNAKKFDAKEWNKCRTTKLALDDAFKNYEELINGTPWNKDNFCYIVDIFVNNCIRKDLNKKHKSVQWDVNNLQIDNGYRETCAEYMDDNNANAWFSINECSWEFVVS